MFIRYDSPFAIQGMARTITNVRFLILVHLIAMMAATKRHAKRRQILIAMIVVIAINQGIQCYLLMWNRYGRNTSDMAASQPSNCCRMNSWMCVDLSRQTRRLSSKTTVLRHIHWLACKFLAFLHVANTIVMIPYYRWKMSGWEVSLQLVNRVGFLARVCWPSVLSAFDHVYPINNPARGGTNVPGPDFV